MWDTRYGEPGFAYGTEPNDFLYDYAKHLPKELGPILSLAEGEGRNAVFLAQQGYTVHAVDSSAVGLEKATALAEERGVTIHTAVGGDRLHLLPLAWRDAQRPAPSGDRSPEAGRGVSVGSVLAETTRVRHRRPARGDVGSAGLDRASPGGAGRSRVCPPGSRRAGDPGRQVPPRDERGGTGYRPEILSKQVLSATTVARAACRSSTFRAVRRP